MSAGSRKPDTESFGIESSSVLASSRLQTGVLPFLTTYFGPRTECAGFVGVICRTTRIVQHPHRSQLLLNGRFGSRKELCASSSAKSDQGSDWFFLGELF